MLPVEMGGVLDEDSSGVSHRKKESGIRYTRVIWVSLLMGLDSQARTHSS